VVARRRVRSILTDAVGAADRPPPTRLRLDLEPTAETAARAAGLVARATADCSFFTFNLTATGGALELAVAVPDSHVEVLEAWRPGSPRCGRDRAA
jgi:hypothetical protein